MDSTCSMVGCYNSNSTLVPQQFYQFPRNFDLCMLWVQNCGRAELFEDFAYGGAQPFINKVMCSDHFNTSEFNDPHCMEKGLKPEAIPNLNCYDEDEEMIVVKQEFDEIDDSFVTNSFIHERALKKVINSESNLDNLMKQESNDTEVARLCSRDSSIRFEKSIGQIVSTGLKDDTLIVNPYAPLLVVSNENLCFKEKILDSKFQRSQNAFRMAWKRSLESAEEREARNRANALRNAFKRANETNEQRTTRNRVNAVRNASRRAKESDDERKDRLYKNAVRAALKRSMESEDEQKERKRKNALRAACRRSAESETQRAERRLKDKIRSADRRKRETELQSKIRRYNDAVRAAFRRNNETDQQKQQRRMYDVVRAARRRSNENPNQRLKRLLADKERAAKRRLMKKLSQRMSNLQNTFYNPDLSQYLDHDQNSSNSETSLVISTNDSFSNDELSNQSSSTYIECDDLGNSNDDDCNKVQTFNVMSDLNSSNSFNKNNNNKNVNMLNHLPNLEGYNSRLNSNSSAAIKHQEVSTVTSPEVVWCT